MNGIVEMILEILQRSSTTKLGTFICFAALTVMISTSNILAVRASSDIDTKSQSNLTDKVSSKSLHERVDAAIYRYGWISFFIGAVMIIFGNLTRITA